MKPDKRTSSSDGRKCMIEQEDWLDSNILMEPKQVFQVNSNPLENITSTW